MVVSCVLMFPVHHLAQVPFPAIVLFISLAVLGCGLFNSPLLLFQWDIRTGEVVQEYDRHLGAVNTITFVDENRRFVSTSDDKSLRVWEW